MSIGTLQERSLHAALKQWYARPGDRLEEPVDGYVIDICRPADSSLKSGPSTPLRTGPSTPLGTGPPTAKWTRGLSPLPQKRGPSTPLGTGPSTPLPSTSLRTGGTGDLLIEIQTANFSSIKHKLSTLVRCHRLRLVHPIAREKWIVQLSADGLSVLGRRKSPKRGTPFELFGELVSCPELMAQPNFSVELLLTREEEVRRRLAGPRRRRKPWRRHDRQLIDVVGRLLFEDPTDFRVFFPDGLPSPFTSEDLARELGRPRWLAQQMTYCLRKMGAVTVVGKRRGALLYSV